jgi:hypothetical protein
MQAVLTHRIAFVNVVECDHIDLFEHEKIHEHAGAQYMP